MLEGIITMIMIKFQQKREGVAGHQLAYTPLALGRLSESVYDSRHCKALYSGQGVYQVEDRNKRWIVNLLKTQCGCGFWELTGIPYRHAVTAMMKTGEQPESYVSRYYSLEMYKKAYTGIIQPLSSADQWEKTGLTPLEPPKMKPKTGRPAHKRRRSKNEDLDKPRIRVKSQRCSNCKQVGHKYKQCSEELEEGLLDRIRPSRAKENKEQQTKTSNVEQQNVGAEFQDTAFVKQVVVGAETAPNAPVQEGTSAGVQVRTTKKFKRAKITPYRGKRRKITTRDEDCASGEVNNTPTYVENNYGMGLVYGKQATTRGTTNTGRGRGRPPKPKPYEGIAPLAPVESENLSQPNEVQPTQPPKGTNNIRGRGRGRLYTKNQRSELGQQSIEVGNVVSLESTQVSVVVPEEGQLSRDETNRHGLLSRGKGWRSSRRLRSEINIVQSMFASSQPSEASNRQVQTQARLNQSQPSSSSTTTRNDGTIAGLTSSNVLNDLQKRTVTS